MNNKKILVTTGLLETFPRESHAEVVFLGEWCRIFKSRDVWKKFNSKVIPYHWDDRNKLLNDYQDLQIVYEKILLELSAKLNQMHNVNYTLMYWRILIGPWLNLFIGVLFDRYTGLKSAFKDNQPYQLQAITRQAFHSVPNDMRQSEQMVVTDDWNESIYVHLIELCWPHLVEIRWVAKIGRRPQYSLNGNFIKTYFKKKILPTLNKIVTKKDDVFFIESYLPLKTQFKLQVRLGQMPTVWKSDSTPVVKPRPEQRNWHLENDSADGFEKVLREMIPKNIPTAYLEGYSNLNKAIKKLYWPKYPKTIFTSNSFFADDVFKAWAAKQKNENSRLVIGQHGGNIGTSLFSFHEDHQIEIADTYISWGWSERGKKNIKPVGNIKCFGLNVDYNPNGGALMVELSLPRYSYHMMSFPMGGQYLEYFDEQKTFLSNLPVKLRKQVTLRLSRADYDWNLVDRWTEAMPEVHLDKGSQDIKRLIKQSRLCVSTYNATTFLESMTWNVPTIIFWNKHHWELNKYNEPYFELLEKCGIFHGNPECAARKMIDIWDDIDSWWHSNDVQKARQIFVDQYSKIPENPLKLMEEILTRSD